MIQRNFQLLLHETICMTFELVFSNDLVGGELWLLQAYNCRLCNYHSCNYTSQHQCITVTSQWVQWCLKSPASPLFLLNCLFRRRWKKSSKLHITGLFVWGNHQWPLNSTQKWPAMWKMFPFDNVIMGVRLSNKSVTIIMLIVAVLLFSMLSWSQRTFSCKKKTFVTMLA